MPNIPGKVGLVDVPMIISKRVLLVEGNDDANFFQALLKYMNILDTQVQIRMLRGKDNYRTEVPALLNDPGFSQVSTYAFIRDADKDAEGALRSIQKVLKDNGQPFPSVSGTFAKNSNVKVGIFIMPGNEDKGMLEDLCLQSVKDHKIMPYVNDFMANVKETMQRQAPKNESKAKVQAYLSGMDQTFPHLGVAALRGYWPFENEAFTELRLFIEEFMC